MRLRWFGAKARFEQSMNEEVTTAPDIQFRTTITENLQANAALTLVGSPKIIRKQSPS